MSFLFDTMYLLKLRVIRDPDIRSELDTIQRSYKSGVFEFDTFWIPRQDDKITQKYKYVHRSYVLGNLVFQFPTNSVFFFFQSHKNRKYNSSMTKIQISCQVFIAREIPSVLVHVLISFWVTTKNIILTFKRSSLLVE